MAAADTENDFIIRIHRTGDQYDVAFRYANLPDDSQVHQCRLPPDLDDLRPIGDGEGGGPNGGWRSPGSTAATEDLAYLAPDLATVREIGTRLFQSIVGTNRSAFEARMAGAAASRSRMRIRIDADPKDLGLFRIPWEALWDPKQEFFLSSHLATPLQRILRSNIVLATPAPPKPPIRILIVIANPLGDLNAGGELADIQLIETIQAQADGQFLHVLEPLLRANRRQLTERLAADKPHVVHYIGHGSFADGRGLVHLHDERDDFQFEAIPSDDFSNFFSDDPPALVVLNSCQGATASIQTPFGGTAQALIRRGVPSVVAMQFPISDAAAIAFSKAFYRAIVNADAIDVAAARGRSAILQGPVAIQRELISPVLYCNTTTDGRLFDPAPPTIAPPASAPEESAPGPEKSRPGSSSVWKAATMFLAVALTGVAVMSLVYLADTTAGLGTPPVMGPPAGSAAPDNAYSRDEESGLDFEASDDQPAPARNDARVAEHNSGAPNPRHLRPPWRPSIPDPALSVEDPGVGEPVYGSSPVDLNSAPTFGSVSLRAGFVGDPYLTTVVPGGDVNAAQISNACVGNIGPRPDLRLSYNGGDYLRITARSHGDVSLVINGPDGQWVCDDDSGGGYDAAIVFSPARSGQYDIWVGSFDRSTTEAIVSMSELRPAMSSSGGETTDPEPEVPVPVRLDFAMGDDGLVSPPGPQTAVSDDWVAWTERYEALVTGHALSDDDDLHLSWNRAAVVADGLVEGGIQRTTLLIMAETPSPVSAPQPAHSDPASLPARVEVIGATIEAVVPHGVFVADPDPESPPGFASQLDDAAAWLAGHPLPRVELRPILDASATSPYERTLGERRRDIVLEGLIARGVDEARLARGPALSSVSPLSRGVVLVLSPLPDE